jgi:superfamily II DNA or RNA helicase
MTRIEKLNKIQEAALEAFEKAGFRGTAMLCPGTGKTFLAFKAAYKLRSLGVSPSNKLYFLAETNARKITIKDEAAQFKKAYGLDILSDFELVFACYQGLPVEKYGWFEDGLLVILDEIHDTLTDNFHPNLTKCRCPRIIGLTGAMSMESSVFPSRLPEGFKDRVSQAQYFTANKQIKDECTKGQMLEMFCPVFIRYPTDKAIEDGVIAPYKSIIIEHELNKFIGYKSIWKGGPKKSEYEYYMHNRMLTENPLKPAFVKKMATRNMTECLYDNLSKSYVTRAILARLERQKTIIFNERVSALERITPNTVTSKNVNGLVSKFNSGEINVIGSARMLAQGITLEGVENVIFMSYSTKWHQFEQRRARIRFLDGKQAKLFFFVTKETFEERWINMLRQERGSSGNLIKEHDLNIEATTTSDKIIDWYAKYAAQTNRRIR